MPRPQPQDRPRKLIASWSPGKKVSGGSFFSGIFLDTGVDQNLDVAALAADWQEGRMSHQGGDTRSHWLLPTPVSVHILIGGVPYTKVGELAKHPDETQIQLLGCRWPEGERSSVQVHVLFADLLRYQYETPIPFTVSSNHTDDLIDLLLEHNALLTYVENRMRDAGKPRSLEFYEVAVLLRPGEEKTRASREDPAATAIVQPLEYAHPKDPTGQYLRDFMAQESVERIFTERYNDMRRATAEFNSRQPRQPEQSRPAGVSRRW